MHKLPNQRPFASRPLRSAEWFAREGKYGFIPRSWMKAQGFGPEMFNGRPVICIANTWSELTPCNRHLRDLVDHVKRGVLMAGGFPLEFPVTSLGEPLMRPTTMMFRNLAAMDVEETIRGNPIDGVILLAGCDKTTPALLMGAARCNVPAILLSGGPMLNGRYKGRTLASGTDIFRFDEDYRTGKLGREEYNAAEAAMIRSAGSCMTMGTASTNWVVDAVPGYVERDLRKFLECGILAHGFARARRFIPRALATTEKKLVCAQCFPGKPGAAPAFSPAR